MNKAEDIEQLIYRELPPDRYCYIHNFIVEKDKEIERLNTDKEQLTSLVNSCQEEIRKLKTKLQTKYLNKLQELKGDDK